MEMNHKPPATRTITDDSNGASVLTLPPRQLFNRFEAARERGRHVRGFTAAEQQQHRLSVAVRRRLLQSAAPVGSFWGCGAGPSAADRPCF